MIIGVRQILISPDGTVGSATGSAVGGIAGAQFPGSTVATAFGAIGGNLVGGISGAAAEKAVGKTKGWEYIVQETGDKLVSITQTSKVSLPIGMSVLVIAGTQQARIVPDYTVAIAANALAAKVAAGNTAPTSAAPTGSASTEVNLSPLLPNAEPPAAFQLDPTAATGDPTTLPDPAPASPAATPAAASGGSATPLDTGGSAAASPPAAAVAPAVQATPAPSTATPAAASTPTPAH